MLGVALNPPESMLKIADIPVDLPIFLAPMAGITDLPFRDLVLGFGAGRVVSEMVASHEMMQRKPGVRERAELGLSVDQTTVQIAGRDAAYMAAAAAELENRGARIIDINMGCPAKKVTSGYSGAALMKTPEFAISLIRAVKEATSVPVTLKMRLGWDHDQLNAPDLARMAEDAGVSMITVHGRTRCQFYKDHADWAAIAHVVNAVNIPVIANGDIIDVASAQRALDQSGAAGVMIGRGAQGRPWILAQIAQALFDGPACVAPTGEALWQLICEHHAAMIAFYGPDLGQKTARKHLGWYMDEAQTPAAMRREVLTEKDPARISELLYQAICGHRAVA